MQAYPQPTLKSVPIATWGILIKLQKALQSILHIRK